MKQTKGFNLENHVHFGYLTYEEYFNELGITKEQMNYMTHEELDIYAKKVEESIAENSRKYIDEMIKNGFTYTFDDIQNLVDINSRNTIQTKFIPSLRTMYITKPCRDLMYSMFYGLDFYYSDFLLWVCPIERERKKRRADFKDKDSWKKDRWDKYKLIDIAKEGVVTKEGITREKLRMKLWFTSQDLTRVLKENFKIDKGSKQYEELDDIHIECILDHKLLSESTIRERLGLVNGIQVKRRIEKGEIDLLFKVSLPNGSAVKPDMVRYCCASLEVKK